MNVRDRDCTLCPLGEARLQGFRPGRVVRGMGPTPCKIMFIGQAPGRDENERGVPFIGQAGQRLNQCLALIDLPRDDVFATNVCSCYPPGDRAPKVDEVDVCIQGLYDEIRKVKPEVLVLLGSTATHAFFKTNVTSVRGMPLTWEFEGKTYKVMSTFHPAATLRRWEDFEIMKADFQKVRDLYDGKDISSPPGDYKVIRSIHEFRELVHFAEDAPYMIIDIECEGFDPVKDKLLCVGVRFKNKSFVIPWTVSETLQPFWGADEPTATFLMKELLSNSVPKVGHNIANYDRRMLEGKGFRIHNLTYDTMLAHHVLDENTPHNLEFLQSIWTTIPFYKSDIKKWLPNRSTPYSAIPSDELYKYNANDILVNDVVYLREQREFIPHPKLQQLFYNLTMPLAHALYDLETTGIMVDVSKAQRVRDELNSQIETLQTQLFETVGYEFNPRAPAQLEKVLFQEIGLKPIRKTDSGRWSTDEETLTALAPLHPVPGIVLELRKASKYSTTYLGDSANSLLRVDANSRVHPHYLIIGPKHGRVSTVDPNIQAIPRDGPVKELCVAPEGFFFVEIDESLTEMRMMAYESQDSAMLKAFREKKDIHVETAASLFDMTYDEMMQQLHSEDPEVQASAKDKRFLAKFFDFGVNYGRGPHSIAAQYGMTIQEAEKKYRKFLDSYPGVEAFQLEVMRFAHEHGFVVYPSGRRRRVPGLLDPFTKRDSGLVGDMERSCIASIVQGCSADVHHYTLIACHNMLKANKFKSRMIMTLHDAWFFEIAEDEMDKVLPMISDVLLRVPLELMGLEVPVKMSLGKCWGDKNGVEIELDYS